jgi:hypothetical protein
MKIKLANSRRPDGFILLMVVILAGCSLIILSGVMYRTSTIAMLNTRNTQLSVLQNAAEAATEKVYAQMATDFQNYGPGLVAGQTTNYQSLVPTTSDNAFWGKIQFSDGNGHAGKTWISFITNYTGPLPSQYPNEFATTSPLYRIVSNATMSNSPVVGMTGTAQEDILLALVPITTYAIFYNGVLEFSDCAPMTVNGRVHSNAYICVGAGSGSTLTFNNAVTTCGTVSAPGRGGVDPWTLNSPSTWATTFANSYSTGALSVNLSISMTNTHSIIDIPPAGELPMSVLGQTRLFDQAQVVIIVTNSPSGGTNPAVYVTLQTGYNGDNPGSDSAKENFAMTNATQAYLNTNSILQVPFLSTTNSFYDQRQGETNYVTQIDVAQYSNWINSNTSATGKFSSGPPTILYVADRRQGIAGRQAAVRLVNGSQLPANNGLGFSVATQNPLYVEGNYNTTVAGVSGNSLALGSTTNGASVPAALLADSLTILSPQWQDNRSTGAYNAHPVTSDVTLNAALVTGAVPSTGTTASTFSGGVHNLTRFLEDWSNVNLTLNTSIVNLFNSKIATNQFQMPGAYYNPPQRLWGFDTTYYNPNKQPPGVPCALVPIRFNWQTPAPGVVTSN